MSKRYCHIYTEEQKRFLRDNIVGRTYSEITGLFNETFDLSLNSGRISAPIKRYGLRNGRDCKFSKGHEPANKGQKGIHLSPATEFKKGNIPANHKPVGSERVNRDGYIEVKVAEPRTWRLKHRVVWEREYGPIPKGYAVIFADGDPLNCEAENLMLITRKELLIANRHGLIKQDADITRSGIQTAQLIGKMYERR